MDKSKLVNFDKVKSHLFGVNGVFDYVFLTEYCSYFCKNTSNINSSRMFAYPPTEYLVKNKYFTYEKYGVFYMVYPTEKGKQLLRFIMTYEKLKTI